MSRYKLAAMSLFYALNISPDDFIIKALLHAVEAHLGLEAAKKAPLMKMSVIRHDRSVYV